MSEPLSLSQVCGGSVPAGLAALPIERQRELLDTVETARNQQRAELRAALDRGFELIPRVLRTPIKKVIFG